MIDGVLAVAMATPENTKLVRRLAQISAIPLGPVFGLPGEIDDAMSVICANERSLADSIAALERNALYWSPISPSRATPSCQDRAPRARAQ